MSKIIVIGANHAGTAAINTIYSLDPNADVTVIDRNSNISFLGCGMALWIGQQISGSDGLFYSSKEKLEAQGAVVHMETEVSHIDFQSKKVFAKTKDGLELVKEYDKLILATGSLPVVPDIPGTDLENVQMVKLFQNAEEVIAKLNSPDINNVAVVGAGYIGVELAEAFERIHKKVTLIDVANRSLANYYDPSFTNLIEERLRDHKIDLRFNEGIKGITGNGKAEKIVTDKGEYDTDMVVLAIGFKPNNDLGKNNLELFSNGAYLVNKKQETSMNDVYAVGDCATVYDNALDDVNYIALATNAVRSGVVAAYNVCGTPLESVGVQGSNGISIYGLKMVATGLTYERAKALGFDAAATEFEDMQKPEFIEAENSTVNISIVYDKTTRRVLGAQIASDYDISMAIHMFSFAIQEKATIDKLKLTDIFFLPHFNKPYNYITMACLGAE